MSASAHLASNPHPTDADIGYGEITLKDGRLEQTNFDTYQVLRMNEAPA
jgi:hypothetical protein